jgi:hypothetical protein
LTSLHSTFRYKNDITKGHDQKGSIIGTGAHSKTHKIGGSPSSGEENHADGEPDGNQEQKNGHGDYDPVADLLRRELHLRA